MTYFRIACALLLLALVPFRGTAEIPVQASSAKSTETTLAGTAEAVQEIQASPEIQEVQENQEAPMPDAFVEEDLSAIEALSETTVEMSLEERARICQYDIPMPWGHELFEKYRKYYLSATGRKILANVMQRAVPFLDYIKAKVQEYGLPAEIAYLPFIESAYSPFAVSRSGATGIWQFMQNSIKGYGLSITEWVDERRDFMKSTDAALKKLMDNYKALQDWPLAIAAYNAGLGAVTRAVSRAGGDKDFWHLYDNGLISKQALDYVPKFLAVASILRYPELYELPLPEAPSMQWETVPLDRQVDLRLLASKAEIPMETLSLANAELHYTITPPVDAHLLKVPADKAEQVRSVLSDPSIPMVRYEVYKVIQGDTLTAISRRYGVSISMIVKVNPGLNPDRLKIGQTLMIPLSLQPLQKSAAASTTAVQHTLYTVKKGDTLYGISRQFGTTAKAIAELNGISLNSVLSIGQRLKIPAK